VARADLTAVGEEGLKRATLEGERRYCGNTIEELTGLPVMLMERDKLGLLLDPRTLNCAHIAHHPGLKEECLALLEEEYVRFGLHAREFKAESKAALQAKEAARFEHAGNATWPGCSLFGFVFWRRGLGCSLFGFVFLRRGFACSLFGFV
jgi:hypothetical protein